MLPDNMMKVAKGENQATMLFNCDTYGPQQWPAWQDTCKTGPNMLEVTNSYLIGLTAHSTGEKPRLVLESSQLPEASKVMELRRDSSTSTLLDQH